jgi:heavy metal sensor kinase
MRFRPRYVRDRLMLWQVGVFGVVLIAYICGATLILYWQLTRQLYRAEVQDMLTVEGLLYLSQTGELRLQEDYFNNPKSRLLLDRLLEVRAPDGQVVFSNDNLHGQTLGGMPSQGEGQSTFDGQRVRLIDGTYVLRISHAHRIQGHPFLIRIAYRTSPIIGQVRESFAVMLFILPLALIASGFAGYRFAGQVLRPLEVMARRTEEITASRLNDRIPVENPDDELGVMAIVVNCLLQRLEESFDQLKQFTSDVSHQLRTPLASIRSVGEVGLQRANSPERYRQVIASMLEETDQLTNMVNSLLTVARADAGQLELHRTSLPLKELINDVVGIVGILAEERKQKIQQLLEGEAWIHGDRALLRLAVMNILDNAIKYSPPGGLICIRMMCPECPARTVELSVEDNGPGIPEESRGKVFDRFYRVEGDRSREAAGTGLGLTIAKSAVEAHGGKIGFRPSAKGGAVFYFQLPLSQEGA